MLLGSEMLEVATGLSFLYLLLSIVCSTLTEWISWIRKLRANALEQGIKQLVTGTIANGSATPSTADRDAAFMAGLLGHPLIEALKKDGASFPSYIHARTFSGALIATVAQGNATLTGLRAALEPPADAASPLIPEHLRGQLAAILADAGNDVVKFRTGVESWFDDAMERVGGWYKRTAQQWTIAIAVVVTLLLNANTFVVASNMLNDPTARAVFVAEATQVVASPAPSGVPQMPLSDVQADLQPIGFGLGWAGIDLDPRHLGSASIDAGLAAARIIGWLITVLALSMGAPFWFDAVGRLVNLRAAGKPPGRADAAPGR